MKTKILCGLREAKDFVSGQELCEQFGVSRTAVWKAIKQLREAGYEIEAVQNRGYRLIETPDILSDSELSSRIHTQWAGRDVIYKKEVDSTNTYAKQLGEQSGGHGTLVVADIQTAGRGRRGRNWVSPEGCGIWMSLLLKPDMLPGNASMLTLVMALAVQRALEKTAHVTAQIKWPNDLVVNGKKICGILTEMSAQMDEINYIVVGVGINANMEEFPQECRDVATSVYLETGAKVRRADLVASVMEQFEFYYDIFMRTQDLSGLMDAYNACMINEGREVRVLDPKKEFTGIAMGINERGELMVGTGDAVVKVDSGEVSVRGVYGYV